MKAIILLLILICIPTLVSQSHVTPDCSLYKRNTIMLSDVIEHHHRYFDSLSHHVLINDVELLHPYVRLRLNQLIDSCCAKGITLVVLETYRTPKRQNFLFSKRVTKAKGGQSFHQYGLAFDVAIMHNGSYKWHNRQMWNKVGAIGESLGLRWGGRWSKLWDPGHFEWSDGCSATQLFHGSDMVWSSDIQCILRN